MARVALVRGMSRSRNIHDALSLIREDLQASINGKKKILIKPNLTALKNIYANTSVEAVEAVIDVLDGLGTREIMIGESSGGAYYEGKSTRDVFRNFRYDALREQYPHVRLISFDEAREYVTVPVETIHGRDQVKVVKPFWDYTISLAIPKTHDYAIATFSLKNMMGLVAREDRLKIHGLVRMAEITNPAARLVPVKIQYMLRRILPGSVVSRAKSRDVYLRNVRLIHRNLLALFKCIRPDLGIIDGFYGMQGDGPSNGDGIHHGIAIASLDAVKADAAASACMGLRPEDIGYLKYCEEEGMGSIALDHILGVRPEDVTIPYTMHRDYRYQKEWR